MRGTYVVILDPDTRELLVPGERVSLDLKYLTQWATVGGKGILDSMELSTGPQHFITAYFDSDGAASAAMTCLLFPDNAPNAAIAGPVVVACFGAQSQSEATVQTSQYLSVAGPVSSGPYIHPSWPTIQ